MQQGIILVEGKLYAMKVARTVWREVSGSLATEAGYLPYYSQLG